MIEADIHKSDDTRRSREKVRSAVTAGPCGQHARLAQGLVSPRSVRRGQEVKSVGCLREPDRRVIMTWWKLR
jgi:hypothetical protein